MILVLIDSFWLNVVSKDFFTKQLGSLLGPVFNIWFGLVAWLLLTFGIYYFVIPKSESYGDALLNGSIFGLVVYGAYDFTNLAILNWSLLASVVDIFWGGVLCAVVSLIGLFLSVKIFKIS